MTISFSVGSAIYDDPPKFTESIRAVFTAMSLQLHHPLVKEYIIVDNNPHTGNPLRALADKTGGFVRYIEMGEPKGTSAPRNRVFAEAKYEYVACIDAHVLLYPGSFEALADFYENQAGENCPDILHGQMMTEKLNEMMASHLNDQWRAEMWGTWARAWQKGNTRFSCVTYDDADLVFVNLPGDCKHEQRPLSDYELAQLGLPFEMEWPCHERKLEALGCFEPQYPFPIPGHGMGFFACRKDSWLPFHSGCRGFGGEEVTTGYRFRRAGRLAWCIPGCKWWHHFDRPQNIIPYLITRWHRIRNYLLEFQRMGLDPRPIRAHFDNKLCCESEWQQAMTGIEWPTHTPGVDYDYFPSPEEALAAGKKAQRKIISRTELLRQQAKRS